MPQTLSAEFETRRDAEMAIEHLVQEYDLDRSAISIVSASLENSSGTKVAGSDLEGGQPKQDAGGSPKLPSRIMLSVEINDDQEENVLKTFFEFKGKKV